MSDQRIISQANLVYIEQNLAMLKQHAQAMSHQLNAVEQEVEVTRGELEQLISEFLAFVREDRKMKQLQLAETRIVKIRQQIEKEFGHHDEVRRHVLGILQAADVQLIRRETMKTASEELMMAAPRYWLAPALVALAAWIHDDPTLANRAVAEALRRHPDKTCLFFALICRRAGRYAASLAWLEHYFSLQTPKALEREAVVLVDGVTNGVFGIEARARTQEVFRHWLDTLSQDPKFRQKQLSGWMKAFQSYVRQPSDQQFPYLARYSPTWPQLQKALAQAYLHQEVLADFQRLFEGPIEPAPTLVEQVDALLEKLVSHFDEEELSLRREERRLQLIIDHEGDVDIAKSRFDQESQAMQHRVDFGELLSNAAFHPESSHASIATRRFSIALSRDWAQRAHANVTAGYRAQCPRSIEVHIDDWVGSTTDGSNEGELIESIHQHLDSILADHLRKNRLKVVDWVCTAVGFASLVSTIWDGLVGVAIGGAALIGFGIRFARIRQRRKSVIQQVEQARPEYEHALRAILADVVEYRRAYESADKQADQVSEFLESLSSTDFIYSGFDRNRVILT
ncbi:hypothetical protein IW967_02645 [Alicyclobacillus mali]|uniref:Uncharacterized protein n=1 Tax=Alicyclobacillus mali (ex Roth et al. 2021) TaxID=1123961 RepID=A0ABS0F0E7_9BACL|nr:hypothetical protein [Alicyclobacillus mali (ex Roth et al. 2021)]MBF8376774.1 hypothetical protein [Alicyclobacillus mali (ex Roth et al. 2021)]